MVKLQKLLVGSLNVYHLHNKLADVSVFLNNPTPFHIFGISETRLNSSISDDAIAIPNYSVFRRDPSGRGQTGIAVYIHHSIEHHVRRRHDLETSDVECVWIEVKSPKSPSFVVGFLYRNPSVTFEWYDQFTQNMDNVQRKHNNILLMGDFNIDMLKPHPAWDSVCTLFNLKQLVISPTRITATSSTLIDHIYTNKPDAVSHVKVPDLSVSDHYPVICNWSTKLPKPKKNCHTTITYRSFKNFNQSAFLSDLDKVPFHTVLLASDPDTALSVWYDLFLRVLDRHAPLRVKRVKSVTLPPWLTPEIMQAMKLRNELRRERRFDEFKKQRNVVRYMVRAAQKKYVRSLIKDSKDISALWKALNSLTRGPSSRCTTVPSHLSADSFNDYFVSVAQMLTSKHQSPAHFHSSDVLTDFCKQKTSDTNPFSIPILAVHEVGELISNLKNKKSSGPDDINAQILKLSLPYTVESLTYIYNLCISQNVFPSALKTAKVIPLPKTKDRSDPNNYRPISLLSVLSKPLERHIHKNLLEYLETRKLLHPFQSGFRPRHSCHTALARLVNTWLNNVNNSQLTGVIYLDFRKAFDLVDHETLVQKLHCYLSNTSSVSFFSSYLAERKQKVLVNGLYSSLKPVELGVPQGSILGPLLFCIHINDLPLHISKGNVQCDMFADDTSIHTAALDMTSLAADLQHSLNEVSDWCKNNSMLIHPLKTKCMIISTRQKQQLAPLPLHLSLDGNVIEQVCEHRLLGITVDNQLKWQTHANNLCKTLSQNLFMLSKLKHLVDFEARKLFYDAHIRSHLSYASTVWDGCSDVHLKRLNSLHRRAAKIILPDPSLTTDSKLWEAGILSMKDQLKYNKSVFMFKIWNNQTPEYLSKFFRQSMSNYGKHNKLYIMPRPRIDLYKSSLSFDGAALWNLLPVNIKTASSLNCFKERLFQYLSSSPKI